MTTTFPRFCSKDLKFLGIHYIAIKSKPESGKRETKETYALRLATISCWFLDNFTFNVD